MPSRARVASPCGQWKRYGSSCSTPRRSRHLSAGAARRAPAARADHRLRRRARRLVRDRRRVLDELTVARGHRRRDARRSAGHGGQLLSLRTTASGTDFGAPAYVKRPFWLTPRTRRRLGSASRIDPPWKVGITAKSWSAQTSQPSRARSPLNARMLRSRTRAWKAGLPGLPARFSVFASAPNSVTTTGLPANIRWTSASRRRNVRADRARRLAGTLVPALVHRHADHVEVAVQERPRGERQRAPPDVDRRGPSRVEIMEQPRGAVDELRLAAGMAVAGDLVAEAPREDRRMDGRLTLARAHPLDRALALGGGVGRPVSGRVHRTHLLPDEDARRVEALEEPRIDRVLLARRIGADRLEALDDRVHVAGEEGVAAARRVLVHRSTVQAQRRTVEPQAPAAPAQLAQTDPLRPARLSGHEEVKVAEGRMSRRPQVGLLHAGDRAHAALLAGRQAHGREGQRPSREDAIDVYGPRGDGAV